MNVRPDDSHSRSGKSTKAAATLAALLMLTAARTPDYKVQPASVPLLPGRTLKGEQIAVPGAVIAQSPLGRPETVLLVDPIDLDRLGQKRHFSRETVFESARVAGIPGDPPVVFCETEQDPSFTKAMVGSMGFGLVGLLRPTKLVTRYCLYDSDNDEKLDHAILIGAKGDSGRAPFEITPARYGLISGLLLGDGSELRLRYAGTAGEKDSLSFDAELMLYGMSRPLPEVRHRISIARLPAYGVIEGAVVTVLEFDPQTKIARIRIDRDLAPGRLVVPEQKP
jgi:hypothetical protein